MIRCEVIENFTLKDFDKLKNVMRKSRDVYGKLFEGDTFYCDESMAEYLAGKNPLNKVVVKVIEIEPEKTIEEKIEDIRNMDVREVIPKEKFEKLKKEFELKPKKKKTTKNETTEEVVEDIKEAKIVEEKETIDEAVAKIEKTKKTKNNTKKKLTK